MRRPDHHPLQHHSDDDVSDDEEEEAEEADMPTVVLETKKVRLMLPDENFTEHGVAGC